MMGICALVVNVLYVLRQIIEEARKNYVQSRRYIVIRSQLKGNKFVNRAELLLG
jgi:hypothetical protein